MAEADWKCGPCFLCHYVLPDDVRPDDVPVAVLGVAGCPGFFTVRGPRSLKTLSQKTWPCRAWEGSCSYCRESFGIAAAVTEAHRLRAQRPSGAGTGQCWVWCCVGTKWQQRTMVPTVSNLYALGPLFRKAYSLPDCTKQVFFSDGGRA